MRRIPMHRHYSPKYSFKTGVFWVILLNSILALSVGVTAFYFRISVRNPADLSILMPIYNKAQYLNRSLGSARHLPLGRFRAVIICLDDASTDNSVAVVRKLQQRDPRIVLHQNPARLGTHRARLKIATYAKTKWSVYLDPDDEFYRNGSLVALELAETTQADIVQFGCLCLETTTGLIWLCWREPVARTATREQLFDAVFKKCADWHLHRKIFRTELLQRGLSVIPAELRDLMLCRGEDLLQYTFIISVMTGMYYFVPDLGEVRYHGLPDNSLTEAYESTAARLANVAMIKKVVSQVANRTWAPREPNRTVECQLRPTRIDR
jgi:hypothetical protein